MSTRRLATDQPDSFAFTPENMEWVQAQIAKFPPGKQQSAVIPMLWRAQKQNDGWVSEPAMRCIADMLDMAYIRVYEVATFYTMFNLEPVGKYHVQLCGTTPCWLRGANDLKEVCDREIGPKGSISEDGLFSWVEVECLGACCNAPMVQINDDYYEDLDAERLTALFNEFRAGREPKPGSTIGRASSEPEGGATTLSDPSIYDPAVAAAPVAFAATDPNAGPGTGGEN